MGCGASSLRGQDYPAISADTRPSAMRRLSSAYMTEAPTHHEHYETEREHEQELRRIATEQSQRRPSKPAYVDPNDRPMPPKTTHEHYHRRPSEAEDQKPGWSRRVKSAMMVPADQRGMGENSGMTREEVLVRGYPSRGSDGIFVSGGRRKTSRSQGFM